MNYLFTLKRMIFVVIASVLIAANFAAADAQTKNRKRKTLKPAKVQIADKISYEPDAELLKEMQRQVRVVESKKDWARLDRQKPFVNQSQTRTAYTAQFAIKDQPDAFADVIIVYENAADKFYELRGFDFPWRSFTEIKWKSDDVLEFEQWVNPHNGGRYAVNVKTGKVAAAGYVRSK